MDTLKQQIEALLFASDAALASRKIKDILELESEKEIRKSIAKINKDYESIQSPLQVVEVAGGFQIVTRPEFSSLIKKLYRSRAAGHLTQRALETMAIVAYRQPVTKTEIEAIRGVNVDAVMRTLIERNLITVTGRMKAPGNPLLYGTTKTFLEYFGLKSIKDLPKLKEIDELLKSDDKFLESLDQTALQQMYPEQLGLTSMLETGTEEGRPETGGEPESMDDGKAEAADGEKKNPQSSEQEAGNGENHDAT